MRKINNVGQGGLVLSTLYIFESEREHDDVFGRLKQKERENYMHALADARLQYQNALIALAQSERDSIIEKEVNLCVCGHERDNHSPMNGNCIRYPGEDPCQCTNFRYMWNYDGTEGKRSNADQDPEPSPS